jgi:hypothetical protein
MNLSGAGDVVEVTVQESAFGVNAEVRKQEVAIREVAPIPE